MLIEAISSSAWITAPPTLGSSAGRNSMMSLGRGDRIAGEEVDTGGQAPRLTAWLPETTMVSFVGSPRSTA